MRLSAIVFAFMVISISAFASDDLIFRSDVMEVIDGTDIVFTPQNFAGFLYDVDSDLGAESLKFEITGNSINVEDAVYTTYAQNTYFEHDDWGRYKVMSVLGERYFVGYGNDCQISAVWSSLVDDHLLNKVLLDSNQRITIGNDEDLLLKEDYKIRFDDAENGVKISLYKGKTLVDVATIIPPNTYVYSFQKGDENVSLLAANVEAYVKLTPTSYYTVRGLFQISEDFVELELGSKDGLMEVTSLNGDRLVLSNFQNLDLTQNSDFGLMGNLWIKTANQERISIEDPLRFYVYERIAQPGEYEIRGNIGMVVDGLQYTWYPREFAGFYYDLDEDLGGESFILSVTGDALSEDVPAGQSRGLVYRSVGHEKDMEFDNWGQYYAIGLFGEPYFAGYVKDQVDPKRNSYLWYESEDSNLMVGEQLTKVLVNNGESNVVKSGDILSLEEGYEAKISADNACEMVFIELYRNGDLLDVDYFAAPGTYTYTSDLKATEDIVTLALHVAELICVDGNACKIDGIWQISDSPVDIKEDTTHGKMTIQTVNSDDYVIEMDNEDNEIMLNKNSEINLVEDFWIKTSNQDEITAEEPLRFYIYKPVIVEA